MYLFCEFIFSEYAEGSSNNKYLEIYNASNGTVDHQDSYPSVSMHQLQLVNTNIGMILIEATIAPGAVYIAHPSADPAIVKHETLHLVMVMMDCWILEIRIIILL